MYWLMEKRTFCASLREIRDEKMYVRKTECSGRSRWDDYKLFTDHEAEQEAACVEA